MMAFEFILTPLRYAHKRCDQPLRSKVPEEQKEWEEQREWEEEREEQREWEEEREEQRVGGGERGAERVGGAHLLLAMALPSCSARLHRYTSRRCFRELMVLSV